MKLSTIMKSIEQAPTNDNIEKAFNLLLEYEIEQAILKDIAEELLNEKDYGISRKLKADVTKACQSSTKNSLLISGDALTNFPADSIKSKVADNLKLWIKNGHFDDIGAGKCLNAILALLKTRGIDKSIIDEFKEITELIHINHKKAEKEIEREKKKEAEKKRIEQLEADLKALHDENCCSLDIASTPVKKLFNDFEKSFDTQVVGALDKLYSAFKGTDKKISKSFNILLGKLKFLMKKIPFTESITIDDLDLLIEALDEFDKSLDEKLTEGKSGCHKCITPQNLKYLVASKKTLKQIQKHIGDLQTKVFYGLAISVRKDLTPTEKKVKIKMLNKVEAALMKSEDKILLLLKKIINIEKSYKAK